MNWVNCYPFQGRSANINLLPFKEISKLVIKRSCCLDRSLCGGSCVIRLSWHTWQAQQGLLFYYSFCYLPTAPKWDWPFDLRRTLCYWIPQVDNDADFFYARKTKWGTKRSINYSKWSHESHWVCMPRWSWDGSE